MSRNIFNDGSINELNERTINFQNLGISQLSVPVLGLGNAVSAQAAGTAGLDLISKDTLDQVRDDVLGNRLKNLSTATITTESVPTINGDTINSTPVSTAGKNLMNITSIADLRSQILENDGEEAIRLTAGDGNELNFYTNGTTASELRLQITDATTTINNTLEADDIKVDNANKIICNTYGYRDDNTNPTYLSFDAQHAHIAAPSGIMLNGGFNIRNGNHGEIATTNGNKNLYYKTHGTGTHIFYVNTTTQVLELDNTDSTISSTNLKTNNILPSANGTLNIGSSLLRYNTGYINTAEMNVCNVAAGLIFSDIDNTKITLRTNHTINVSSSKTQYFAPTHQFVSGIVPIFDIALSEITSYKNIVPTTDSTIDLGTSLIKYNYVYTDNIETGTITTPSNTHLEITPNGSGNIRTNRPLEIPAAQSIMLCKENNKHFQLNLAPRNEVPNSATDSYGSGLTFWSSFFSENDAAPRLFANINCRTTGTNWEGGRLDFRVRESQSSGFDGGLSGDQTALTSLQMTITATTVDILKRLNVSSHIIPATDDTSDLGEIPAGSEKRFRNGYINNIYVDTINTTNSSITLKEGANDLLLLNNTETTTYKNILPSANGTISLGSGLKRWDYVHTNYLAVVNDINSGNVYATTIQAPNINATGNIDFTETLGDKILLYGTTYKIGISSNTIDYTSDNTHSFKIQSAEKMRIAGNIVSSTNFIPQTDNAHDIGSGTNRWQDIYATNATIQTSDRNQKKEIDYQDIDQYADELLKLKPCSFKFINNSSNRIHVGLISQDLEGTLFENTGAYIKDRKKKTITENGINKEVDDEGFNYGLRYNELISPLIRLCQKQQEQINQLLKRVELLEKDEPIDNLSFI